MISMENRKSGVYGVDNKGRTLYQGSRGGIYYINKYGRKSYVDKFDIEVSSKSAPRFNKAKSMPAKHIDPNHSRYASRQSINNQYLQYTDNDTTDTDLDDDTDASDDPGTDITDDTDDTDDINTTSSSGTDDTNSPQKKQHIMSTVSVYQAGYQDCMIPMKNRKSGVYGVDNKGRTLYQGSRGGIYYINKSGRKSYVDKFDIELSSKSAIKTNNTSGDAYAKDDKGRTIHQGPRGGLYYIKSGRKSYVNSDVKISSKPITDCKYGADVYGVDDKGRTFYQGSRGGTYYISKSGRKSYVDEGDIKLSSKSAVKTSCKKEKDDVYGKDNKGRTIYQGTRGVLYYINKSGHRSYVTSNIKILTKHKNSKRDAIYGKDDKGRILYQGPKAGLYYINESGQKRYAYKSAVKASYKDYTNIKKAKEKPHPVTKRELKRWMKIHPRWFDGEEVSAKTVTLRGGSITTGKDTNIKDTIAANNKRWPVAIKAELKNSKGAVMNSVKVANPLPGKIRDDKGDAGHLVAKTLGGDTDPTNIIPQNPTINEQMGYPWRDFECEVLKFMQTKRGKYTYTVKPIYGNVKTLDVL